MASYNGQSILIIKKMLDISKIIALGIIEYTGPLPDPSRQIHGVDSPGVVSPGSETYERMSEYVRCLEHMILSTYTKTAGNPSYGYNRRY
jgi:hypothetical protein